MSIYFIELSFKDRISNDILKKIILESMPFGDTIVPLNEYWDIPEAQRAPVLAIEVVYAIFGYKTYLQVYGEYEVVGKELGKIAQHMSKISGTDVAVGDYVHAEEIVNDRYIVFHPDGTYSFGVEYCKDGISDVEIIERWNKGNQLGVPS